MLVMKCRFNHLIHNVFSPYNFIHSYVLPTTMYICLCSQSHFPIYVFHVIQLSIVEIIYSIILKLHTISKYLFVIFWIFISLLRSGNHLFGAFHLRQCRTLSHSPRLFAFKHGTLHVLYWMSGKKEHEKQGVRLNEIRPNGREKKVRGVSTWSKRARGFPKKVTVWSLDQ